MPPVVSWNGKFLGGATLYDWDIAAGENPVEKVFTVSAGRALELEPFLGEPGTLVIGPDQFQEIFLLEIQPANDPYQRRLRFADARWLWPKRWVSMGVNVRRATGSTYVIGENRVENQITQPEIEFAKYSLFPPENPSVEWEAENLIRYVLSLLGQSRVRFKNTLPSIKIRDLMIEGPGDVAIRQVLDYLPGAALYLDRTGEVVIYDTQSQEEAGIIASLPPLQTAGGDVRTVNKSALRPSKVVVLFTPEIECRFNFDENPTGTVTNDTNRLKNVAPVPDLSLTIDGQSVQRGALVEIEDLFTAWGNFGRNDLPLSRKAMREMSAASAIGGPVTIGSIWGANENSTLNALNMQRADVALNSWRRLFQIEEEFLSRLAAVRPYRASLLNPATGAYAPAEVFCDWIRRPSSQGVSATAPNTFSAVYGRNYADNLSDAVPAPARVVQGSVPGVFSIEPNQDSYGIYNTMLFGFPEGEKLPARFMGLGKLTGEAVWYNWINVHLTDDFKLAVVLTVVPGSPNTIERFHQVEVDAPVESKGPVIYARVFPGVATARFAWDDAAGETIVQAIRGDGPRLPDNLLLNKGIVDDVAKAVAARIYETLLDRPLGNAEVNMQTGLDPGGTLSRVRQVMSNGATTSQVTFQAVTQPADIWRYLNPATRAIILREMNKPTETAG